MSGDLDVVDAAAAAAVGHGQLHGIDAGRRIRMLWGRSEQSARAIAKIPLPRRCTGLRNAAAAGIE